MTEENRIQSEILAAIGSLKGVQVLRINTGVFHDSNGVRRIRSVESGTFDLLVGVEISIEGYRVCQLVWLEVKVPGKNLSNDQERHKKAWDGVSAVCKKVTSAKEALEIINNIHKYIKCAPKTSDFY